MYTQHYHNIHLPSLPSLRVTFSEAVGPDPSEVCAVTFTEYIDLGVNNGIS